MEHSKKFFELASSVQLNIKRKEGGKEKTGEKKARFFKLLTLRRKRVKGVSQSL